MCFVCLLVCELTCIVVNDHSEIINMETNDLYWIWILNKERKNEGGKRKHNSCLQIIEDNKKPSMVLEIEYHLVLLHSNLSILNLVILTILQHTCTQSLIEIRNVLLRLFIHVKYEEKHVLFSYNIFFKCGIEYYSRHCNNVYATNFTAAANLICISTNYFAIVILEDKSFESQKTNYKC